MPAYRAASALLLLAPETPLLFMGQEWAATSPFLYFTEHHPEPGRLVTAGRRNEFHQFAAFADPAARERIPDPQAESTFVTSRLNWDEREDEPHRSVLRLYAALLGLRRREPAFRDPGSFDVAAHDDSTISLRRQGEHVRGSSQRVCAAPEWSISVTSGREQGTGAPGKSC